MEKTTEVAEKTVELPETKAEAPAVAAPTREDLVSRGWSEKEIEAAGKRGMVAEPKKKEPVVVKADDESEPEVKAEEKKAEPKKSNGLPEALSPEKEAEFVKAFGPGTSQHGLYFRMKSERRARQAAEDKAKDLEIRLKALESVPRAEVEEGEDPEDKPLTVKQLRELQKQEAEAIALKQQQQQDQASTLASAQTEQEEYARSIYEDFDPTVEHAKDVIKNVETMFPEKWKQTKVIKLIRDLQVAAAHADKFGLDEYNAAMIAYELGQMHPNYGKPTDKAEGEPKQTGPSKDPKAPGGLKPEQLKRIQDNTQRRASSASVSGGGGKRVVSAEDVTAADLAGMDYKKRASFRQQYPEQYARLMRG